MSRAAKLPPIPSGASPSGAHYVNLFQCCPRKFFLRYVRGWKPRKTSAALLNGSCFHYAKSVFYSSQSRGNAMLAVSHFFSKLAGEYESEEELALARTRLPAMVSAWIEKFGLRDLARYTLLETEREHKIPLLGGFSFTLRLDALVRDRDGNLLVLETKTSGWRPELTELDLSLGDQVTAYIRAVSLLYKKPLPRIYVLPDILSWPKASVKISQMNCYRGELLQRDAASLEQWTVGTSNLLAEISQKVAALRDHSEYALFPRNTQWCTSFSRACEYANVCRREVEVDVPSGFLRDTELPELTTNEKKKR